VCLKVPVGQGEEDTIYEYLNLLLSRPEVAEGIGRRAREYARREFDWRIVARKYADFLGGRLTESPAPDRLAPEAQSHVAAAPEDVLRWAPEDPLFRSYVDSHLTRLLKTLEITPAAQPGDAVLEMGSYLQITPALREKLGYTQIHGCYYGPAGQTDRRSVTSIDGQTFEIDLDLFDAEKDPFPYADGAFATVLCCELIEHLFEDPMHLMSEINRVLRPGGHVVLTTPNIASLRAISALLQGYHPGFFPPYIRPNDKGAVDPRHNREYAPREIYQLLVAAGFEVVRLETGEFRERPHPELEWVNQLLRAYRLPQEHRGDGIYALGRKSGPVRDRWPNWLYA
jgi:SAM-dependent methyltransferase